MNIIQKNVERENKTMFILVCGPKRRGDLAWFVARNLKVLGHNVESVDFIHNQPQDSILSRAKYKLPFLDKINIAGLNKKIFTYFVRRRPDLVIVCKGQYILPETVRDTRKKGIRIVNWYPDGVTEIMTKFILESLKEYDFFFTKEPYILKRMKAAGLNNVYYLPHCCDPQIHKTIAISEEDRKKYASTLSIVGSWYPYREDIVSHLAGFDLKIWGRGWNRAREEIKNLWQGREVVAEEQALVFNATDININTSHLQDIEGVNKRVFDIAGCGAFQLCYGQSDLGNLFKVGEEIIAYKDIDELKKLIAYYLVHEKERKEIGRNSQKRAYGEHTYRHRLEEILALIK